MRQLSSSSTPSRLESRAIRSILDIPVVCCTDSVEYGGSEINLQRFLFALNGRCAAVVHQPGLHPALAGAIQALRIDGVRYEARNDARAAMPGLLRALRLVSGFPRALFVVWAHHTDSNRWLQVALALVRRPFVVVEQLVPADRSAFRESRLTVPVKRFVAWHATRVVVNAPSQVKHYREMFRLRRGRVVCVRAGRPVAQIRTRVAGLRRDLESLRRQLTLPVSKPIVTCVARLAAQKNQASLLWAIAQLRALAPAPHVALVGDGPDRARLEALAERLLPERVTFAGRVEDPVPWLAAADLFVLPSRAEGLPGALIEAMAAGLPCVATAIPGNVDLVRHNVTGRLVPVENADALSQAIGACLTDQERGAAYASAGLALVETSYDEARERREWQALLDEVSPHA